jgi:peptidyl-prolyl cis-trans isomerase C
MRKWTYLTNAAALLFGAASLFAQPALVPEPAAAPMPSIVASVNGQAIYETDIELSLQGVPSEERAKYRPEVIEHHVNVAIIDQYLLALKIEVDPQTIDKQMQSFKEELKKHQQDYEATLKRMKMTEADMKAKITKQLRWDKFVDQQATEEKLKALFNYMPEAFNGTMLRARHILLPSGNDAKSKQEAATKLKEIKAKIEADVAADMAKLPADADAITRERKRQSFVEVAFSDAAKKFSTCPSNQEGGDLRWFPRFGAMAESFSKVAYSTKEYEISDVVATQFGYHLILVVGKKPGVPTKFEDEKVKDAVKEIYESKIKDAVLEQMRPRAKIEIVAKK